MDRITFACWLRRITPWACFAVIGCASGVFPGSKDVVWRRESPLSVDQASAANSASSSKPGSASKPGSPPPRVGSAFSPAGGSAAPNASASGSDSASSSARGGAAPALAAVPRHASILSPASSETPGAPAPTGFAPAWPSPFDTAPPNPSPQTMPPTGYAQPASIEVGTANGPSKRVEPTLYTTLEGAPTGPAVEHAHWEKTSTTLPNAPLAGPGWKVEDDAPGGPAPHTLPASLSLPAPPIGAASLASPGPLEPAAPQGEASIAAPAPSDESSPLMELPSGSSATPLVAPAPAPRPNVELKLRLPPGSLKKLAPAVSAAVQASAAEANSSPAPASPFATLELEAPAGDSPLGSLPAASPVQPEVIVASAILPASPLVEAPRRRLLPVEAEPALTPVHEGGSSGRSSPARRSADEAAPLLDGAIGAAAPTLTPRPTTSDLVNALPTIPAPPPLRADEAPPDSYASSAADSNDAPAETPGPAVAGEPDYAHPRESALPPGYGQPPATPELASSPAPAATPEPTSTAYQSPNDAPAALGTEPLGAGDPHSPPTAYPHTAATASDPAFAAPAYNEPAYATTPAPSVSQPAAVPYRSQQAFDAPSESASSGVAPGQFAAASPSPVWDAAPAGNPLPPSASPAPLAERSALPGRTSSGSAAFAPATSGMGASPQANAPSAVLGAVPFSPASIAPAPDAGKLLVGGLAFCRKVESYGVYVRFDREEFAPGQEVLLYAEVENFASELGPDGYHTVLESGCRIFDRDGEQVASRPFPRSTDVCRNRRRDFFHTYRFVLPTYLRDGDYRLQLVVQDGLTGDVSVGNIPLRIRSQAAAPRVVASEPSPTVPR